MKTTITTFDTLLENSIRDLSYDTLRYTGSISNTIFRQLPAVAIYPTEIVEIEGGERGRATVNCKMIAIKSCVTASQCDISNTFAAINNDFILLSSLLLQSNTVIGINSFESTFTEAPTLPQQRVIASIEMEVIINYNN